MRLVTAKKGASPSITAQRVSTPAPEASARAALELFAGSDLWLRDVRVLSAGQRQRVALARAVATGPRLLPLGEWGR